MKTMVMELLNFYEVIDDIALMKTTFMKLLLDFCGKIRLLAMIVNITQSFWPHESIGG
jgi:hypothetical protein